MKKILMIVLVIMSYAFVSSNAKLDQEILLIGTIINPFWWKPNGKLEFSLFHENLRIQELKLKGNIFVFSKDTVIPLSKINKDSLTPISLSASLDKIVRINIDPVFSEKGGILHIKIKKSDNDIDKIILLVLKEKGRFNVYKKEDKRFLLISSVDIQLDADNEIVKYSFK